MKKIFLILIILILVVGLGGLVFVKKNIGSVTTDSNNKIFIVESGQSILTIGKNLEEKKLVKNHYVFLVYAFLTGQNKKIQSGTYRLSSSITTPEIIKKLTTGGIADYWLKIIDGSRVEEVALLFPEGLPFSNQDFLTKVKTKEGYLFPDSYLIPEYYTVDQIITLIQNNFDQKFTKAKENSNTLLTDKQVLVLASLLEREGKSLESKKMIAGILMNRFNIGMAFQLDATVQYARDNQNKFITKYWQPVSKSDFSIDSPYNTYKNPGLPPKPICSPGYNSLYAAFHPTDSDYLYYITGNDGKMYYAKTLEEHNSNIAKYLR